MTLKELIDLYTIDEGGSQQEKLEFARSKLFDFEYPFWNEEYRKDFETRFMKHYFMREIGQETEFLFKWYLEDWLNINMPYWNKVFESELIEFDPLTNTKITDTDSKTKNQTQTSNTSGTGSSNGTTNGSLTEDNFDRQLESNNPDSRLQITTNDGQGVIEYASEIRENNANNSKTSSGSSSDSSSFSSNGNATNNETEDSTKVKDGKIGTQTYSAMLNEYRSSLIRVEKQILNEMNVLFMNIY
jgi:hypothetical protein